VSDFTDWDDGKLDQEIDELLMADIDLSEFFGEGKGGGGFGDPDSDGDDDADKPEVEFTEELLEEHNYVVLYFDNQVDWLQAKSIFDIKSVRNLSTSQDGKGKLKRIGVGRVIRGADFLTRLTDGVLAGGQR